MKKILSILFLFTLTIHGAPSEVKIIQLVFNSLFKEMPLRIYVVDEKLQQIVHDANFEITNTCDNADLIYHTEAIPKCSNKPLFTTKYLTLKEEKQAIGAFYWKKGRPNIIFIKDRLEAFHIKLPQSFEKYVVDGL